MEDEPHRAKLPEGLLAQGSAGRRELAGRTAREGLHEPREVERQPDQRGRGPVVQLATDASAFLVLGDEKLLSQLERAPPPPGRFPARPSAT